MAEHYQLNKPWRLVIPSELYAKLTTHLFPGDGDEHAAVILAGVAETDSDVRLLARNLHLARDGQDYVAGTRSYRMLRTEFITDKVLEARDERLSYLAVHNHHGMDQVAFSSDDLRSHEHVYPALLDITRGGPVGALVFANNPIAGDIWMSHQNRQPLSDATIVGEKRRILRPQPIHHHGPSQGIYDRQTLIFGEPGQRVLSTSKVAIVGLGGAGSLIAEFLGRLGVGNFVLVDPERAEVSNLPRLTGASRWDAMNPINDERYPRWLKAIARRLSKHKVNAAKRNIRRANPKSTVSMFKTTFDHIEAVRRIKDCDYIFLAADTMRTRLLFNAIVHQYLIPGCQVGVKVLSSDGNIPSIDVNTRIVTPDSGCLWCNQLINQTRLQLESIPTEEMSAQLYIPDDDVVAPGIITLNALATSHAVNDFLFYITGLTASDANMSYVRFQPTKRTTFHDTPSSRQDCIQCGRNTASLLARGNSRALPTVHSDEP